MVDGPTPLEEIDLGRVTIDQERLRIGLISDTHIPEARAELWPQVFSTFADVDVILHGGERITVGDLHLMEFLLGRERLLAGEINREIEEFLVRTLGQHVLHRADQSFTDPESPTFRADVKVFEIEARLAAKCREGREEECEPHGFSLNLGENRFSDRISSRIWPAGQLAWRMFR
jgi:hypothetical protein